MNIAELKEAVNKSNMDTVAKVEITEILNDEVSVLESEEDIHAKIRANERLAREYKEIGDTKGYLRCTARVKKMKEGLK